LNEEVWIVGRGKEGAVVISFPAMTVFAMMLNSIRTWSSIAVKLLIITKLTHFLDFC
jgi:hypothetical protein